MRSLNGFHNSRAFSGSPLFTVMAFSFFPSCDGCITSPVVLFVRLTSRLKSMARCSLS